MTSSDLISPAYLAEQRKLHKRGDYGARGFKWAGEVRSAMREFDAATVLDYGCGQGSLGNWLRNGGIDARDYDPAINGKNSLPEPADLVVCTDVLEHIEPDRIDAVVRHMISVTKKAILVVVSIRPAKKSLSDGRNAHVLLHEPSWWRVLMQKHGLKIKEFTGKRDEWCAILVPE